MSEVLASLWRHCATLAQAHHEILSIVGLSLSVSAGATVMAALVGVPVGFAIGLAEFPGRRLFITIFNSLMAIPTVVVGLFVYCLVTSQGPLGVFGLLFTPWAMVMGQFILGTPIVVALTISAVQSLDPRVRLTIMSLGAGRLRGALTLVSEARFALVAAIVASFARVISEVGSAMIVGGNIKGYTRTMTTAIALETSKGEFGQAIALGIVLLLLAFSLNIFFQRLQGARS